MIIIQKIFQMIELKPTALPFFSKPRSRAIGNFSLIDKDGSISKYNNKLRELEHIYNVEIDNSIEYVAVVESHAGAKKLLEDDRIKSLVQTEKSLIIFECSGVPDIPTRLLVHIISEKYSNLIVGSIKDCDIAGFDFHSFSKNGSVSSMHLNEMLTTTRIRPIGIFPHQFSSKG